MIEVLKTAITTGCQVRIRMNNTPEGNFITIEPYVIVNNILFNQLRLFMYVVKHWSGEGGAIGWKHVPLTSILEVELLDDLIEDRPGVQVEIDRQVYDQVFPEIQN